jgi:Zn finger protein HypA/HybF involved in hydrogenase expression
MGFGVFMSQLRVLRFENGEPAVACPRCDEKVQPVKNPLLDGFDCPECDGTISSSVLMRYLREVRKFEEGPDEE